MTITEYFNSAVIAHAIAAADQLGLFDEIGTKGRLSSSDLADLELGYLIELLVSAEIIEAGVSVGEFAPGQHFEEILLYKSFFTWLFSASGAVLANGAKMIGGDGEGKEEVVEVARDGAVIARASSEFGRLHLDPHLLSLPEWQICSTVVDLGCGDATRLIRLVEDYSFKGIGIDLSTGAVERARVNISDRNLSDRIQVAKGDIRALERLNSFQRVDTLLCCLAGHDLWPRDHCVQSLQSYLNIFPRARTLVLCETVRTKGKAVASSGIPTIGYEYLHYLMRQYIPSETEWIDVLSESGWPLNYSIAVSVPANTKIFVCTAER